MFHNENKLKLVALIQFKVDLNHWLCSSFASINHKKGRISQGIFSVHETNRPEWGQWAWGCITLWVRSTPLQRRSREGKKANL